jgi:hypothetical protein
MRAFIQRRLALIAGGMGNVIILGSRHSANSRVHDYRIPLSPPVSFQRTSGRKT